MKRKTKTTPRKALPETKRWEPVCRIVFPPRLTPLTQQELDGLEIPAFLKR